ncbi:methylthioribose-1-phosphate isomerase [Parvibaculum indicum]|uniref:S-methyl-5-thioribose-1-phosphate isomerase n=1 Tax=Parvibaculum indicum TaxID=562969 RepID=UPI001422F0FE|nr:S-methyl-5-thioribose-1-phosphate isomerase [Parvibaculum indicum]NIJ40268.1 methylthioribose-1-phosphate isomerase [Parvibaculum indicum]
MKIDGTHYRTIWVNEDGWSVEIIDQTKLPFSFETKTLKTVDDAARAIKDMLVRGAPLIGATAAYGVCLAMRDDASDAGLEEAIAMLGATRPTAVNLHWALERMRAAVHPHGHNARMEAAYKEAAAICDDDVEICRRIGENGLTLIEAAAGKNEGGKVNILTHCNAGWLACVDWGTALAPIYMAHDKGLDVHVWVDETRPRNQGASLTAFELGRHGVPHTIVPDNAGGHLMQHGLVDMCIVGTDRTTATGDVANKIGTYLKALAAHDNDVPFYVALPHTTIDWTLDDGVAGIPIEQRSAHEVTHLTGRTDTGEIVTVQVSAPESGAANFGFDVTPSRYVTALVTERGIAEASKEGLLKLYPERKNG